MFFITGVGAISCSTVVAEEKLRLHNCSVLVLCFFLLVPVTPAGWQVILCDPIWHVSFRSSEAFANCYTRLLYLLYFTVHCWLGSRYVRTCIGFCHTECISLCIA